MEENDIITDIFGPDPQSQPEEVNNKNSEDSIFEDAIAASNEENNSSENYFTFENNTSDDFTDKALSRLGIQDKENIDFIDPVTGAYYTRSWDSLSEEQQLDILNTANQDPDSDLLDEEIDLINKIRTSGLSVDAYMQQYTQNAEDNFANNNQVFDIDSWDDDSVFAIDLMQRVGADEVTDEEIDEAIAKAKENPTLFAKRVQSIREEYRTKQQEALYQAQEQKNKEKQERYNAYSNSIINEITKFNTVAGQPIQLDSSDQNNLANYILQLDSNGNSQFTKDLTNPSIVVESAFWALYGPQFAQEAQAEAARAFKRGYEKARQDLNSKATVEIRSTNKRRSNYFNT